MGAVRLEVCTGSGMIHPPEIRNDFFDGCKKRCHISNGTGQKKGRLMILWVSLGWQNGDKVFKLENNNNNNNVSDISYNKCRCAHKMYLSVFITEL